MQPVRICIRLANGRRGVYYGGYHLIEKYRSAGRLISASSTSTGKFF